jgi:hypothetical protein
MFGYNRAPGTSLGSFVVTVIGLLIVGVPFYFVVVRQGWAGLSALPYAIPVAAAALAVILMIGHRVTGTGPTPAPGYAPYRRSPAGGIAAGVLLVAGGIFMSFKAGSDVRRYNADPSCFGGFAGSTAAGACTLEPVRITRAYGCGRHGSADCMTLESRDGTVYNVQARTDYRGNVYRSARDGNDRSATAQLFDGRVVQVETQSGRVATGDMPLERERFWTLMGLVGGGFGLIAAAVALVRGIF